MEITVDFFGDEAQTCRTCVHSHGRLWNVPLAEVTAVKGNKEAIAALECSTAKVEITRKIRKDGVLVPLSDHARPIVAHDLDPMNESREPVFVETCGFQLAPKCRNCARLTATVVKVPHPMYPGSTKDVVVAASCSIPAMGIIKDGKRVTCDPKPLNRLARITPSCENCKFRFTTDENWQYESFAVNEMDLTPYEMEQVRRDAIRRGLVGGQIGGAINRARLEKYQSIAGRTRWYRGTVVSQAPDAIRVKLETTQEVTFWLQGGEPVGYTIHRYKDEEHGELPLDAIHIQTVGEVAILQIKLPHNVVFGLVDGPGNDGTRKRMPVFPALPDKPGVQYWTNPDTGERKRIWPRPQEYFTSKNPYWNATTESVEFDPDPTTEDIPVGEWMLHVVNDGTRWRVVDDLWLWHRIMAVMTGYWLTDVDPEPHPAVFRLRLRGLVAIAQTKGGDAAAAAVRSQYHHMVEKLPLGPSFQNMPNFFRQSSLEPFKDYCSVNLADPSKGIDFRTTFGDGFGLERTQYSRTWAYQMERDQWFRATQPGNEVQGEIMRNEMLDPAWPDRSPDHPDQWERLRQDAKVVHLDVFGNEYDDPDELTIEDRLADSMAYLDWLDEPVERMSPQGHPVYEDRRMQVHGYTMYRGSRTEASPNFVINADEEDIKDRLYCAACNKTFPLTQLSSQDEYLPVLECPDCGDALFVGRTAAEPSTWIRNSKRIGIGTAVAIDSQAYQGRQRLRSTLCESWQFRSNPNIAFDDVLPQAVFIQPFKPDLDKAVEDIQMFEYLGIDTSFVGGTTRGGWSEKK
jgi:hypothetical protein